MPADTHALAGLPLANVLAHGVDAPGDLVPWNARVMDAGPMSFFDEDITMTNTASLDLNAYLTTTGLRDWAFDNFEISTRFADLNGFHEGLSVGKLRAMSCEPRDEFVPL
jgi:hypothetical protein